MSDSLPAEPNARDAAPPREADAGSASTAPFGCLRSALTLSIISHGHGPLLCALLAELDAQPSLAGVKVIVTANLLEERLDLSRYTSLDVHVISNAKPRGFGANHNAAFALCSTPWFGVLNPDLSLAGTEPFSGLLRRANDVPDLGAIAPKVVGPSGAVEDSVRPNLTPWSLATRVVLGRRKGLELDHATRPGLPFYWLAGMCVVIDSRAFRKIGGFDERFFLYCEDYDLCARLYLAGHALLCSTNETVVHAARRNSHRSLEHLAWHLASLWRVWSSVACWQLALSKPERRPRRD